VNLAFLMPPHRNGGQLLFLSHAAGFAQKALFLTPGTYGFPVFIHARCCLEAGNLVKRSAISQKAGHLFGFG
jgi:hypothetical protein